MDTPKTISSPKLRDAHLDLIKALLILLVTFGHAIQYVYYMPMGSESYWTDPPFQLIYMFHMPLFMALSGYLGFRPQGGDWRPVLRRRFMGIALPWLAWTFLYAAGEIVAKKLGIGAWGGIVLGKLGYLWFLGCLFFAWAIVAVLERMPRFSVLYLLGVSAAIYFLPEISIGKYFKFIFPFYAAGYALARWRVIPKLLQWSRAVGATLALAAFIACAATWSKDSYVYLTGSTLGGGNINNIALRLAAGAAGSALFVYALSFARRWHAPEGLLALGRDSFVIYVLQIPFFKVLSLLPLTRMMSETVLYALLPLIAIGAAFALRFAGNLGRRVPLLGTLFLGAK